ncbi:hypothetical protein AB0R72_21550 (plasmid) [Bacillus velezensis]
MMARVKKLNRVLTVSDERVSGYLRDGYDQIDETGNILKRATGGRTVPVSEHNKALDKIEALEEELKAAQKALEKAQKELKAKKDSKKE